MVQYGTLRFYLVANDSQGTHTFPGGEKGHPWDWDFVGEEQYSINVLSKGSPMYIFNAATDANELNRPWLRTATLVPTAAPSSSEFQINMEKIMVVGSESEGVKKVYDYSMRYNFQRKIEGRKEELNDFKRIVVSGRALIDKEELIQVALTTSDGSCFGGLITLKPEQREQSLPLSDLKPVKMVLLPRPYPTFLPYFFEKPGAVLDMSKVESVQISIGPGLSEADAETSHGFAVTSIRLE
jgi:hypothetical protein